MSRDPRRKREADTRRNRREFATVDEPQPATPPVPPVWADIVAMYRKMLTAPGLRMSDPRAWQSVRAPVDIAAAVQAEEALEAYRLHLQNAITLSDPDPHYAIPPQRLTWSPRAYAGLRGLTGTAEDMFTEIATAIQNAKEDIPW